MMFSSRGRLYYAAAGGGAVVRTFLLSLWDAGARIKSGIAMIMEYKK